MFCRLFSKKLKKKRDSDITSSVTQLEGIPLFLLTLALIAQHYCH